MLPEQDVVVLVMSAHSLKRRSVSKSFESWVGTQQIKTKAFYRDSVRSVDFLLWLTVVSPTYHHHHHHDFEYMVLHNMGSSSVSAYGQW